MALGGADAPICSFGDGCGTSFGWGSTKGIGGVGFHLISSFVVSGDNGLEFREFNFEGANASPGELDRWVS